MKSILFAIFSGLLLILCFPRIDLGFLAWFAMVPLLVAIKDKSLKSTFGLCLITGILFYACVFYWFKLVKGVSLIDFSWVVIYLSLCYFGLFGLGLNLVSKRTRLSPVIVAPVLWVTLEYARSYAGVVAHPQMLMGHSQYLNLPFIQISAFTGAYGVSFLIVMVNVTISDLIHNRRRTFKPVIATVIALVISLVYGYSVLEKGYGNDTVNVTVIQGNIPRDIKWKREFIKQNFQTHVRLTKEASNNDNTSLIVWPETAVPGPFKSNIPVLRTISTLARDTDSHLLVGSSQNPKFGSGEFKKNRFNSAFLFSPEGGIKGQYNKIHLLPFSEYLPYKDSFFWPSKYASRASNFVPGTEYTIFNLGEAKFGVTICWENLYPELVRQFVKKGANFMVNITNEVRLGEIASYQFAAISVFRAVENRTSIARAANSGISCFINPHGKIIGSVRDSNNKEAFIEGYLTMDVPLSHERTFYTMYGDVFVYMNMAMAVFMIGLSFFRRKSSAHEIPERTRKGDC